MSNRTARLAFALLFALTSVMPPAAFAAPGRVKPGVPSAPKVEALRDTPPSVSTGRILLPVTVVESAASHAETTDSPALLLPVQIVGLDVESSHTASVSSQRLTRPRQPDKTVLTSGTPTTITVQVDPAVLIANSGATALITATVVDSVGDPVSDVTPNALLSPDTLGSVGSMSTSDIDGKSFGTWTAGATPVSGVLSVGNGTVTGTAYVTLTVGPPATITVQVDPVVLIANSGATAFVTATVVDSSGYAVPDVALNAHLSPSTLGGMSSMSPSDVNGQSFGTWTAGTTLGSGVLSVGNGTVTGTAYVTLTVGVPTSLSIETSPDGLGSAVDAYTMTVYDTLTVYAVRRDQYSNVIPDPADAAWSGTGVVAGNLSPTTGASTTFTPAPIVSGTGTIAALQDALNDTTGVITVLAPNVIIGKRASPNPVLAGGNLNYTLVYTNVGDAVAQNVVVTETYDPNVSFVGAVPDPDGGSGNAVWSLPGTLNPGQNGQISIFAKVGSSLPISTVLTNTVRAAALYAPVNAFTQTTTVTVTPGLIIAKKQTSPLGASVRVSDTINYLLTYTNTGTAILDNVVVTETYDSAVQFVNAVPSPDDPANRRWNIGTLPGGQTGSIAVTVIVKAPQADGTPLANLVTIESDLTAPQTIALPPIPINAPVLSLSKAASADIVPANSPLTYTLRYTNSGDTYASSVVVTDLLPSNVIFVSSEPDVTQQVGNLLTWSFPQVVTNSTGLITVSVMVNNNLDNGTLITNSARIRAAEVVSAFALITNTVVSAPALTLSKSDGGATAAAGQVLTYSIVYSNAGTARAQNVVITDRIPSNVSFQGCAPSCSALGGGVYSFSGGTVNAATSGLVTLTVKVNSTLPAGLRLITNTAGIATTTPGDNPSNNQAQDVDTISTVPLLALTAVYPTNPPYPTKRITYTLRYTNTSAMDTTGVVITATKSPFVTYTESGWTPAGFSGGLAIYTHTIGNLAAGASGTVNFITVLPSAFNSDMDSFDNIFLIQDNGPGGMPVASAIVTTVVGVPDLVVESVIFSPNTIAPDTPFTAVVIVRNQGLGTACNPKAPPVGCGALTVDAFIDPAEAPVSGPYDPDRNYYGILAAVDPGQTRIAVIPNMVITPTQDFIIYFKVDNWDCSPTPSPCIPDHVQHGLSPESDENNNVFGPVLVPANRVYIPLVLTNQ